MEGELRAEGGRGTGCIGAETEEEWPRRTRSRERSNGFPRLEIATRAPRKKRGGNISTEPPFPSASTVHSQPSILSSCTSANASILYPGQRTYPLFEPVLYTDASSCEKPPPLRPSRQTKLTNRPITRPGPQNAPHLLQRQRVQKAHPAQSHTVQSRQGTPSPVHPPPHQTLKHE